MSWRAANSLLVLHQQLKAGAPRAAPPATGIDEWGLIGDAAHDPTSDHTPHDFAGWGSQIVTAADFPNRPDLGLDAHKVLDDIRRSHDARVKYGISNGQMFSSYTSSTGVPPWTWRPYSGTDGHFTHGHLSVVGDARADGTQPWQTIGGDDVQADERAWTNNSDKYGWAGAAMLDPVPNVMQPDGKTGTVPNLQAQTLRRIDAGVKDLAAKVAAPAQIELDAAAEERIAQRAAELVAAKLVALRFVPDGTPAP